MSVQYKAVGWNRPKRVYDGILAAGVLLFLAIFIGLGAIVQPNATAETLIIRATAALAFLLLNIILCVGPLSRLDPRFLPLLYNRRHLGVTMFLLALIHGCFSIFQFHALGDLNPFVSVLTANTRFGSVPDFPFELFGVGALVILFFMAATSHDFWLRNLTAPVWKRLHMSVYLAYIFLVAHVCLGALQSETSAVYAGLVIAGAAILVALHLAASFKDAPLDREEAAVSDGQFVRVCSVDAIPENRAMISCIAGERVAIFRYDGKISAISNVCQHQNGPLGEGRIEDGCVVCPWHGYQYYPDSGQAPPPFTEKLPTFRTKIEQGTVFVDPRPQPPGTRLEPSRIQREAAR